MGRERWAGVAVLLLLAALIALAGTTDYYPEPGTDPLPAAGGR